VNLVIGVADMKVSKDPDTVLVSYSLGSCIGLTVYDPVARIGGVLHFMLPDSTLDLNKARQNPHMFADTGIPDLLETAYALGAEKSRLRTALLGGSEIINQGGFYNIGNRNYIAAKAILSGNDLICSYEDVGGSLNRTLRLHIQNGDTWLKVSGQEYRQICVT
jgi:chemotaxis protein CheD